MKKSEKSFTDLHNIAIDSAKMIHLKNDVEHGRNIDKYGEISKIVGDSDGVNILINENSRIVVHNHISEYRIPTSFSKEDVFFFLDSPQLLEEIVCCFGYYYYIQRGTYKGSAMAAANVIPRIRTSVSKMALKEFASTYDTTEKSLKVIDRDANLYVENAIHTKMIEEFSKKGLIYGRCKL